MDERPRRAGAGDHIPIESVAINRVIAVAKGFGISVGLVSADWGPKQVVFMSAPISNSLRVALAHEELDLEHYVQAATPHDPADEGFISRVDDVTISFPVAGEGRRWY
ncbi:hypothetical protein [Sphingomonas koreensis]